MNTNTNTAPAFDALIERLEDAVYEWGNYVTADDAPRPLTRHVEPHIKAIKEEFERLAALSTAAQPPAGMVMVPVEPTKEMIAHAHQACDGTYAGDVYRAMLAASPGPIKTSSPEIPDNCAAAPKATKAEPVQPERVPLSDRQISDAYFEALGSQHLREQDRKMVTRFARAIESAHGIKPAHKE